LTEELLRAICLAIDTMSGRTESSITFVLAIEDDGDVTYLSFFYQSRVMMAKTGFQSKNEYPTACEQQLEPYVFKL